ncbi:hypothetical protein CHLRE_08g377050v5 [Chlamydomonas reinhardtii]|uniref:Phosphatidylinositol-specific phospholipase C X domain-containing protein n=1 Tax=Chlamydomonas reinhardtii TaxID=3055 RepID=A0A2K3DHT3_CHLRE|nr:uncharacterized protein CHLRE_08g377050v5 [Chlamydomonas reinhardtii]PNW80082.1 hypothetical protein CHLRE_08g377050v5 [Chlamydomonas reinhardtii]
MEWMHDSYELLADRRIDQLLLPGTHDSAAHTLAADQPRLGPSAADRFLAWLARAFPSAVAPWTLTQHAPVYDQLRAGVRFLDLRVAWSPPVPGGNPRTGTGDGVFWCAHTFACQPLKAVLQDVSDFLAATSHEVLVLALRPDWPHRQPFTQHPHLGPRLAADVAAALRGQLYPPPPPVAPQQLVAAPPRKAAPAGGTEGRGGGELGGPGSGADDMAVTADVDVPVSAEAAAVAAAVAAAAAAAAGGLQLPSLRAMVESGRRVLVFFDPPRVPASDGGTSVPAGRLRPHPQPPPPSARVTPPPAMQPAVGACPVGARVSDAGGCCGCGPPALRAGLRLRTCFQGGGNARDVAAPSRVSSAIAAGAGAPADSAAAMPRVCTARTSCAAAAASLHPPPSYRRPTPTTTTTSSSDGDRCSSDAGAGAEGDAGGDCDCGAAAAAVVKPPCSHAPHLHHGDCNGLAGDLPGDRLWLGSLCRPLWADSSSPRGTVTGLLQMLADARRRPLGPGPCWHAAAAATPTPLSVVRDVLRYGLAAAGLRRLAAELEAEELPRLLAAAAPVPASGPAAAHAAEHASAAIAEAAASERRAMALVRTPMPSTAAGQVAWRGAGATQGAGAVAAGSGGCGSSCAAAGVGVGDGDGRGGGDGGGGDLQLWRAARNEGSLDMPGGAGAGPGGLLRWGRVFAVCLDHPSPEALEAVWRLNLVPSPPA